MEMQPTTMSKEMLAFNILNLLLQTKMNEQIQMNWRELGLSKLIETSVDILQNVLDPGQVTIPTVLAAKQKTLVYGE